MQYYLVISLMPLALMKNCWIQSVSEVKMTWESME